jgi:hypothetical protein
MARPARNSSQEYWRPADPDVVRLVERTASRPSCWRCGSEYSFGAMFCHVCGSQRDPKADSPSLRRAENSSMLDLGAVRKRLEFSVPCLVFFLLGVTCMVGAALTGLIFKSETLVDWQAVQLWRIEWLLGAAAALLAGILLKKKEC